MQVRLSVIFFLALLALPVYATPQTKRVDRVEDEPRPRWTVPVLVLRYFPVTADKQNIDISVTSNVGEPLKEIQQKCERMTKEVCECLKKAVVSVPTKTPQLLPA